jgi:hypothetical protein
MARLRGAEARLKPGGPARVEAEGKWATRTDRPGLKFCRLGHIRNNQETACVVPQPHERFTVYMLKTIGALNVNQFGLTAEFKKRKSFVFPNGPFNRLVDQHKSGRFADRLSPLQILTKSHT